MRKSVIDVCDFIYKIRNQKMIASGEMVVGVDAKRNNERIVSTVLAG